MADGQIVIEITGDAGGYDRALASMQAETRRSVSGLSSAFSSIGAGISSAGTALTLGFTAPLSAAAGVAAKFAFDAVSTAEQADIAFATMLGPERAKGMLEELADFAASTPFELQGLEQSTQKLIAMGFEAEDVIPLLTSIGDAASGLGAGQEGIDSITRALGQMNAKGKTQAEEMMQLTEIGIPAWQYLADVVSGGDIPEAMEMVTDGAVDAKTAIGALQDGMDADFGGMMAQQSATLAGILSNLSDSVYAAVSSIRNTEEYDALTQAMARLSDAVGPVAERLMPLLSGAVGALSGVVGGAAGAMEGFASLSDEGVEGAVLLVGALASLGPALVVVGKAVQVGSAVGSALSAAGSAAASFGGKLAGVVSEAAGLASQLGAAGREAGSVFAKSIAGAVSQTNLGKAASSLLDDVTLGLMSAKMDVAECFDGVSEAVAAKFSGVGRAISSKFSGITSKLAPVVRVLGKSGKNAFDAFASKFDFGSIADKGKAVLSKLGGVAGRLAGGLGAATAAVGGAAVGLAGMGLAAVASGADLEDLSAKMTGAVSGLTSGISTIAAQAPEMLPRMVSQLTSAMPQLLDAFVQLFAALGSVLPSVMPQILEAVGSLMATLSSMLVAYGPQLLAFGVQLFAQLAGAVAQAAPQIAAALPGLISSIGSFITSNLPTILSAGLQLFTALATAVVQAAPDIISALLDMLPGLASTVANFAPQLLTAAGELLGAIAEAVPEAASAVLSALDGMLQQLPGAVSGFAGQMASAGMDLIQGIVNGIGDAAGWVASKIQEVCGNALGALKSFFGIASPSKLMAEMGRYIVQGLAGGIEDDGKLAVRAMDSAMAGVSAAAARGASGIAAPFDVPMPAGGRGALGFGGSYASYRESRGGEAGGADLSTVIAKLDGLGRKVDDGLGKVGDALSRPVEVVWNRRQLGRLNREAAKA